jgi:signal transduction histidine kinase
MVGVHVDVTERKKIEQERSELSGRLINAQERERALLAREIHDDLVGRLSEGGECLGPHGLRRLITSIPEH